MKNYDELYRYYKDYNEYVERETDEAFRALCEAEVERDILAAYTHISDEAYQEWVIADMFAIKMEKEYDSWLKEKESADAEYVIFLDDLDRRVFGND